MAKETIGEYLRRERELRQITLEEMVEGTKIALQRLQELENDRLEDMPAEIFVRGFIKSYAEFIGLNPDEVILRYEEELKALQEKEAADTGTVYHCADMKPHTNILGIIAAAILFLAVAAGGYWLFVQSGISLLDIFSSVKEKANVMRIELAGGADSSNGESTGSAPAVTASQDASIQVQEGGEPSPGSVAVYGAGGAGGDSSNMSDSHSNTSHGSAADGTASYGDIR